MILEMIDATVPARIGSTRTGLLLKRARSWPSLSLLSLVLVALTSFASSSGVYAAEASSRNEPLLISKAWVRAMPPGRKMTAAYMQLQNQGSNIVTIEGVSTVAADASLHETTTVDGQSRMRSISSLRIAPGESVVLEPGGRHIMLMGLSTTPVAGEALDLCIELDAGRQCLSVPVQRSADSGKQ